MDLMPTGGLVWWGHVDFFRAQASEAFPASDIGYGFHISPLLLIVTSWAAAGGAHASGWLRLFQVVPFPLCASAGDEDLPQDVSNWECRCERENRR